MLQTRATEPRTSRFRDYGLRFFSRQDVQSLRNACDVLVRYVDYYDESKTHVHNTQALRSDCQETALYLSDLLMTYFGDMQ